MRGLEDVVRSGKVRYIGCSNLAAWQVMKANGIADKYGWTKFISTQNYYSIAGRDLENELVPMVEDQQMGILPWSPLAGGFLSGKYTRDNNPKEIRVGSPSTFHRSIRNMRMILSTSCSPLPKRTGYRWRALPLPGCWPSPALQA